MRDDQFERIAALLPGKARDPGRAAADNRLFVEAVLWLARTGSPWRDLPAELGLWNSVYQRFARWSRRGVWHRVFAELAQDADFEEVFIESTIVRAHQRLRNAAHNFSFLRRLALNLFRANTSRKMSLPRKRKTAAWNPDYLAHVLGLPVV